MLAVVEVEVGLMVEHLLVVQVVEEMVVEEILQVPQLLELLVLVAVAVEDIQLD
jgi:hypothetical protein